MLSGASSVAFPIDNEGLFHIPGLLPGSYDLTVESSHHDAVHLAIHLGENNVDLDVTVP
jgi:hypothetical protein